MLEPYLVKKDGKYFLKIANNIFASPCGCLHVKGIHFHHNSQGTWNPKGETKTYIVEPSKEYPDA